MNADLEEEWSTTFSGYGESVKTVVTHLCGCKNHFIVLADRLRAFTYSENTDGPCIPWIIIKEQKEGEAEKSIRNGHGCFEEEDCECAEAEFAKAGSIYEDIKNLEGVILAEEKTQKARTCLDAQESLRRAVETLESESTFMVQEHLSHAEEAYESLGNEKKLEEIREYLQQIKDIEEASGLFDTGRSQIKAGLVQQGINNLEASRDIYKRYNWLNHVQLVEEEIEKAPSVEIEPSKREFFSWYNEILGAILSIFGTVILVFGGVESLGNRIYNYCPKWKRIDNSIKKMQKTKFISSEERELFSPFERYFCRYVRKRKELQHLGILNIQGFRLAGSTLIVEFIHEGEFSTLRGLDWEKFIEAFRTEEKHRTIFLGLVLFIIGTILMILDQILFF